MMFDYFDKADEQAANKTADDIYSFYTEEFYPMEYFLRSMARQYLSRNLMDTSEEHPLECDIVVETEEAFGLSTLEMPRIEKMYSESTGSVWLKERGIDDYRDLDNYPIYELMSIVQGFKDYEK